MRAKLFEVLFPMLFFVQLLTFEHQGYLVKREKMFLNISNYVKKRGICLLFTTPNYNLIISNCPGGLSTNVESQNLNRKDWSFRVSINGRALSNKKLPFLDLRVHFFLIKTLCTFKPPNNTLQFCILYLLIVDNVSKNS